jgi:phosphoglycolate phosphatase-like HAD superfamily hydrolase
MGAGSWHARRVVTTMDERRPIAIVDLDGVVADVRHRLHFLQTRPKDWDRFFAEAHADPAHPEGLAVIARLADDDEIVFVTGRPDRLRDETVEWLETLGLDKHRLMMRPQGDRRPAAQVKPELVAALARDRDIGIVVDDDAFVLDALRDAGYPTFAADWEKRRAEDESTLLEAQEVSGQT